MAQMDSPQISRAQNIALKGRSPGTNSSRRYYTHHLRIYETLKMSFEFNVTTVTQKVLNFKLTH